MTRKVFIRTMSRVGGSSTTFAVARSIGQKNVYHAHFFDDSVYKTDDFSNIKKKLKLLNNKGEKYNVISLVRDPISWLVSFFLHWDYHFGHLRKEIHYQDFSLDLIKDIKNEVDKLNVYLSYSYLYRLFRSNKYKKKGFNKSSLKINKINNKVNRKIKFVNILIERLIHESYFYQEINHIRERINRRAKKFNKKMKKIEKTKISENIKFNRVKKIEVFYDKHDKINLNTNEAKIDFKKLELKFCKFFKYLDKPIKKDPESKKYYKVANIPFVFFDKEIKKFHNIDVYSKPFDKDTGYSIYHGNRNKLLLIKLEKLDDISNEVFNNFLGIDNFELKERRVVSKNKVKIYEYFCNNLHIPPDILQKYYNSKYVRHFYTDNEIQYFMRKWS